MATFLIRFPVVITVQQDQDDAHYDQNGGRGDQYEFPLQCLYRHIYFYLLEQRILLFQEGKALALFTDDLNIRPDGCQFLAQIGDIDPYQAVLGVRLIRPDPCEQVSGS